MPRPPAFLCLLTCLLPAQVIDFESAGMQYQSLSRDGVTLMFAHMRVQVREYAALQIAMSNGSSQAVTVRPEDFSWNLADGTVLHPVPARQVVGELLQKAGRNDVIHLVSAYETAIYGMSQLRSTNGYEARRRAALGEVSSSRLKAAAAASAIAFVQAKLTPGESTDGALFFDTKGKPMPPGVLRVLAGNNVFEFRSSAPPSAR